MNLIDKEKKCAIDKRVFGNEYGLSKSSETNR